MNDILTLLSRAEAPFSTLATAMYLAAMLGFWAQLFLLPRGGQPKFSPGAWGRKLAWTGAGFHLLALLGQGEVMWMIKAGVVGLFGWILMAAWLLFGRKIGDGGGAIVAPLALVSILYSLRAPRLHVWTPPARLDAIWSAAHIVLILGGYAALAFAFAASLLYLVQENLLKRRKLTGLWQRLPALHVADEWIYRATAFGLSLLTLGLLTAMAFSWLQNPGFAPFRDPKVLFSGATWAIFALYLVARVKLGWHGRRSNLVVIYGFVVMAISFLGVNHTPMPR